jgi:serine phosphatase RsbU (regulator of sigma subunit)
MDAARVGRHFVSEEIAVRGGKAFADDAALVAAELLANARQHGEPPISACVSGDAHRIRIEIGDGSSRSPVRPSQSLSNMTGRGLALVAALSSNWGVERAAEGGKIVWAEFVSAVLPDVRTHERLEAALAAWEDTEAPAQECFTVVLGNVPTELLIEAKAHIDNVVRELTLAAAAGESNDSDIPEHLAGLIETVVFGFRDARDAIKRQALASARRGDPQTTLTLRLPLSAADAGEAYLAALDEADTYSRAARLLTLETPPEHRLFRHWYVEAVVRQLRELAVGRTPTPIQPFESLLISEIRRLVSAQRVSERAARLQRVTAALARARTPEDVAGVVVSEGVEALGASGGSMLVPASDSDHLAVPGAVGYGQEFVDALREERLDAPLPAAMALRTGKSVWLESRQERDREFPALRGFEAATVSMCAVPLIAGDVPIGALRFSFATRKLFDVSERSFIAALAALTAQTLQRTEVYEAERRAALELQRALLRVQLPAIPGWDMAAYYSPAGDQQAGGDFYDVIPLADGRAAAIVGDVMGRGVDAAAAMAEIRSTIRAYALDDPDPAAVFKRVDRFFDALDVEQLVTVLYLLLDPRDNTVQIASAGHIPPLLVTPSETTVIATIGGMPFGVERQARESVTLTLPRGSSLVAVTDGLVERRGEDIDEGVARLVAATEGTSGWDAHTLMSHLTTAAAGTGAHDDDVTVFILRRE